MQNTELKINLLEKNKKTLWIIAFVLFFFLPPIGAAIFFEKTNLVFNLIYIGVGALIVYQIERLCRKPYVLINSEVISLESSAFDKKQSVNWNEIKSIYSKIDRFNIKKTDDTTIIINISKFDYKLMCQIKETVDCIAKAKNIQSDF